MLQKFFDSQATVIERHWRGFWSRKTKFDYYARKKYLEEVSHLQQISTTVNRQYIRSFGIIKPCDHWLATWMDSMELSLEINSLLCESQIRSKNEEVGAEMELEAQHALEAQRKVTSISSNKCPSRGS